jgi:hypothetical protein
MSPKIAAVLLDASKHWRYRVLRGGRGGGKDWGVADYLIESAVRVKLRVLCCREILLTIRDSAHLLLKDRINSLGYTEFFDITDNEIRCKRTGSIFIYKGLRNNVAEIKSLEGIDVCWVMEAESTSDESWDMLTPTIRKPGSYIIISYNPKSMSDATHRRFSLTEREDAIVGEINYMDNPWLPDVLFKEQEYDKLTDENLYNWKWLGKCKGIGQFFNTFGLHNREPSFDLPWDCGGSLIGGLDHGIGHPTSFQLLYIDSNSKIHSIITYCQRGANTETHARNIHDAIESCKYTHGTFPMSIYYDPSMNAKRRLSEIFYRSDIDEYLDVFKSDPKSCETQFIPANNRKIDGCHTMRQLFTKNEQGVPDFFYFDKYNESTVESILNVMTDKNNVEIYEKADGDDGADSLRYGLVAAWTIICGRRNSLEAKKKINKSQSYEYSMVGSNDYNNGWMGS